MAEHKVDRGTPSVALPPPLVRHKVIDTILRRHKHNFTLVALSLETHGAGPALACNHGMYQPDRSHLTGLAPTTGVHGNLLGIRKEYLT